MAWSKGVFGQRSARPCSQSSWRANSPRRWTTTAPSRSIACTCPTATRCYLNPADREQFAAYEHADVQRARGVSGRARPPRGLQPQRPGPSSRSRPSPSCSGHVRDRRREQRRRRGATPRARRAAPMPHDGAARRCRSRAAPAGGAGTAAGRPRERRWCTRPTDPEPEPEPEPRPRRRPTWLLHGTAASSTWRARRRRSAARASCDIVVHDANVSRRTPRSAGSARATRWSTWDRPTAPRSTASRVSETSLMNGDVIGVGQTQLTFERRLG